MKRRALGYARVSTKDQSDRGYSLPAQQTAIEQYVASMGYELVEIFVEDASGFDLERPELGRLRRALRAGRATAVVAYDPDRLSREPEHSIVLRSEFERLGVGLHYVLGGEVDLEDVGAQIGQDVRARIAKEEVRKLIERSRRGKRQKVKEGAVIVAKRPPFGYRAEKGALVIDEAEAETVRLIFRLYVEERYSIREIAEHLSEKRILTRADRVEMYKLRGPGEWAKNSVRKILGRETYIGLWHWGKTSTRRVRGDDGRWRMQRFEVPREDWIPVEVQAIIDMRTWQAAQRLLVENKRRIKRQMKAEYLLAQRAVCGVCGRVMYADSSVARGRRYTYYRCSSRHQEVAAQACEATFARSGEVDERVWGWVKSVLNDPDVMIDLIETQLADRPKVEDIEGRLESIRGKIRRKEQALAKLLVMRAEGASEIGAFEEAREQFRADIEGLLVKERETRGELEAVRGVDGLLDLSEAMYAYQGAMIEADEPFEIRRDWVEGLNVKAELDTRQSPVGIVISCDLGRFVLSQQTLLPTSSVLLPKAIVKI